MRSTAKECHPEVSSATTRALEETNEEDTHAVVENNNEETQEWVKPKERTERDEIAKVAMKDN